MDGGTSSASQEIGQTAYGCDDAISLPSDDEGEDDDGLPSNELDETLMSITEAVKNLYKLSFRIRNPNSRTKSSKASLYKEISNDGRDLFGDHFAPFDRLHVLELIRNLRNEPAQMSPDDEALISRLTKANTTRRRQFRYWAKHGQKLAGEAHVDDHLLPATVKPAEKLVMPPPDNQRGSQRLTEPRAASNMEKSIRTTTEATMFDPKLDLSNLETQSNVSFATTAKDLDGRVAQLPPPPNAASNNQDFVCPYCFVLCPSRHGHSRAWRAHIVQDLQPYLCTYAGCHEGSRLYGSRQAWLDHEGRVHRKAWRCRDHADLEFKSQQSLEQHLRTRHSGSISEQQIADYAEISETTYEDDRKQCSLCLQDAKNIPNMANHLANHLERISTFSLPRYIDDEQETSVRSNRAISRDASSGGSWESGSFNVSETSEEHVFETDDEYPGSILVEKTKKLDEVMDRIKDEGLIPPELVESETSKFYSEMGIDDAFFSTETVEHIVSQIHSLYAVRIAEFGSDNKELGSHPDRDDGATSGTQAPLPSKLPIVEFLDQEPSVVVTGSAAHFADSIKKLCALFQRTQDAPREMQNAAGELQLMIDFLFMVETHFQAQAKKDTTDASLELISSLCQQGTQQTEKLVSQLELMSSKRHWRIWFVWKRQDLSNYLKSLEEMKNSMMPMVLLWSLGKPDTRLDERLHRSESQASVHSDHPTADSQDQVDRVTEEDVNQSNRILGLPTDRSSLKSLSMVCESTAEVVKALVNKITEMTEDNTAMLAHHDDLVSFSSTVLHLPQAVQDLNVAPSQFATILDLLGEIQEDVKEIVDLIDDDSSTDTHLDSAFQRQQSNGQREKQRMLISAWLAKLQRRAKSLSALLSSDSSNNINSPDLALETPILSAHDKMEPDEELKLEEHDDRIAAFVRTRLRQESGRSSHSRNRGTPFGKLLMDVPDLLEQIVEQIADFVVDSSLLAKMILDFLASRQNARAITKSLQNMSHMLTLIYDESIEKHIMGSSSQRLAMKALAAVTYSRRKITVPELGAMVALQYRDNNSGLHGAPSNASEIIRATCGLLMVTSDHMIKFLHPTLGTYFEENGKKWFHTARTSIALACLKYMGSDRFVYSCNHRTDFDAERTAFPFSNYAPRFWGDHVREVQSVPSVMSAACYYLNNAQLVKAGVQAAVWLDELDGHMTYGATSGDTLELSAAHVCASFGLSSILALDQYSGTINALESGTSRTPLMFASRTGQSKTVETLLNLGANVNLINAQGKTVLCEALEDRNRSAVHAVLASPELEINAVCDVLNNMNALMVACKARDCAQVQLLLQHPRLELNKTDSEGHTAVARIVCDSENRDYETLKLLLDEPAVIVDWRDSKGRGLLTNAVLAEDPQKVEVLLSCSRIERNARDLKGRPAIFHAAETGNQYIVDVLVAHGVAMQLVDHKGQGLVHAAAVGGHRDTISRILDTGLNMNAQDHTGATPLHITCREDWRSAAELLIQAKADTMLLDSSGRDAFTIARQYGHTWIMRLLRPESVHQSGEEMFMVTYEGLPAWSLLKMGKCFS